MYALKEKVTEKLSRLLSDSSSHSPRQLQESPQTNSYSMGAKSLSSLYTCILPSATAIKNQEELKVLQSSPTRWRCSSRSWQNQSMDSQAEGNPRDECREPTLPHDEHESPVSAKNRCSSLSWQNQSMDSQAEGSPRDECREPTLPHDEHESPVSAKNTCESMLFEDEFEPQSPYKLMPNLTEDSSFIYVELYDFLQASLPNIVKGCQWVLLYSTLKHGISLRTLMRRSADLCGPGLLIVGDRKGAIFGGLLDCPLKPCPKKKYQGTNQTFVFTTKFGQPRLFTVTGANRYFYMCLNDSLVFGGGGNFALSLDEDLLVGSSGPCQTFGNTCLAYDPEFELKNVELWGFMHSSRYLS